MRKTPIPEESSVARSCPLSDCRWPLGPGGLDEQHLELHRQAVTIDSLLADLRRLWGEFDRLVGISRRADETRTGYVADKFPLADLLALVDVGAEIAVADAAIALRVRDVAVLRAARALERQGLVLVRSDRLRRIA